MHRITRAVAAAATGAALVLTGGTSAAGAGPAAAALPAKQAEGTSFVLSIGGERGNVDLEHGFDVADLASAIKRLRDRLGRTSC